MKISPNFEACQTLIEHLIEELSLYSKSTDLHYPDIFYSTGAVFSILLNEAIEKHLNLDQNKEEKLQILLNIVINSYLDKRIKITIEK